MPGKLYLIPTPLSATAPAAALPALNGELLRRLRYFVVENRRTARRFLKAVDRAIAIDNLRMEELNEHTRPEEVERLLLPVIDGDDCGLLSEAGCPGVADPGAALVALAHRRGVEAVPLVGPSSIIMSLMASGFNGQSFAFLGYLPVDATRRAAALREAQRRALRDAQTQIFIETPYRNNRLIGEIAATLAPDMLLCVASDLTGDRQSVVTRPVAQWAGARYDYAKTPAIFLIYKP